MNSVNVLVLECSLRSSLGVWLGVCGLSSTLISFKLNGITSQAASLSSFILHKYTTGFAVEFRKIKVSVKCVAWRIAEVISPVDTRISMTSQAVRYAITCAQYRYSMLRTELLYRDMFIRLPAWSPGLALAEYCRRVRCRCRTKRIFAKAMNETEKHTGITVN